MVQNLNIDSYEPYVFGLKLNPDIDIHSVEKKVRTILPDMDFEVPPTTPFPQGPIVIAGTKHGAEFKINFDSKSFLIESNTPNNVQNMYNELPGVFDAIKLDIDDSVMFYEILSNIGIETDGNPREIISNSCKINVSNITDMDTFVSGIKINSIDPSGKIIGLVIEPKAGNPNKFYFVNLIYRTNDTSDLIEFHANLADKIKEVINSLGD
jgi:hypothetical protein